MNQNAVYFVETSQAWLTKHVFPIWSVNGIDPSGSFVESLDEKGVDTKSVRRTMVQCRQIYSFSEGLKLQALNPDTAKKILKDSTDFLIKSYSLTSGAFVHSVDQAGQHKDLQSELYTQAFVIFALARSFEILRDPQSKLVAKKLIQYLKNERTNPNGGFTEIKEGKIVYQSNPHMHLFEAVLEWIKVDTDPEWEKLADSIFELCTKKFIDPKVGSVNEFFNEKWEVLLENGMFLFEPGHQYEWAWLMNEYQTLLGRNVGSIPFQLFDLAEKTGTERGSKFTIDQVWSDLTPKKTSARFWPQCERVKAAVALGLKVPADEQPRFARAADDAMEALYTYLETPLKGLWYDTRLENGQFDRQPVKASSLYHIINALAEYMRKRPLLRDK